MERLVILQMDVYKVKKFNRPVHINVEVPGSKSITNRALLLAAMGGGETLLKGVQFSEDSYNFLKALQQLGFKTETDKLSRTVKIKGMSGNIPVKEAVINVGNAGTAARFLTAFTAMGDGIYTVNSSGQMEKRPIRELLEVLEALGAEFKWLGCEYSFPFKVTGIRNPCNTCNKNSTAGVMAERTVQLNIDRSSQFLSALLMAAPAVFDSLTINLTGKRDARSYVRITEQMMKQFGHKGVERLCKDSYRVRRGSYNIEEYQIEPDVSAACYFYAMAAVTGGTAVVKHISKDSLQGDMQFTGLLEEMGCRKEWGSGGELKLYAPDNGKLKGTDADMGDFSDQALTLAAIAPFADSPVTIRGIAHTRGQESDRIAVIINELGRMGIKCDGLEDGVRIYPGSPKPARIQTYNDHRAAMAFTVTGMAADGIEIENPACCGKTFEGYFDVVESLY